MVAGRLTDCTALQSVCASLVGVTDACKLGTGSQSAGMVLGGILQALRKGGL